MNFSGSRLDLNVGSEVDDGPIIGISYGPDGEICVTSPKAVRLFDSASLASGDSTVSR